MITHWEGFQPLPGYPGVEIRTSATAEERQKIIEALSGGGLRTKAVVSKPYRGHLHTAPLGMTRAGQDWPGADTAHGHGTAHTDFISHVHSHGGIEHEHPHRHPGGAQSHDDHPHTAAQDAELLSQSLEKLAKLSGEAVAVMKSADELPWALWMGVVPDWLQKLAAGVVAERLVEEVVLKRRRRLNVVRHQVNDAVRRAGW